MTSRRGFLALAGVAMVLPFAGARAAAPAFTPPAGPMTFRRTFRREMGDGAAMGATRTFAVRFVPLGSGFRIDGDEVGEPLVEAPPSLEAFARLERERRETGLFPVQLDAAGMIVARADASGSPQFDQAVDEALHRIAASGRSADEQAAMRAFVIGLQQATAELFAEPPADLFRPLSAPHSESRDVPLPDGSSGTVSLSFTATLDPATGLMHEAARVVLTRLGATERRSVERWSLSPD